MSGDSGWSAVIHHPSELELQNWNWEENDGEQERELPSTVDMDAIKGGGSWDPANGTNGTTIKSHCLVFIGFDTASKFIRKLVRLVSLSRVLPLGTDSIDSEEDSDSDEESSGGTEGSCSYSDSNSESDDESSGEEEEGEDTGSNSDCTSEHSEQTFSIQETNFESVRVKMYTPVYCKETWKK